MRFALVSGGIDSSDGFVNTLNTIFTLLLAQPVDTASMLREMTDLDRLTRPADYSCRQFSSYDRRSEKDHGTDPPSDEDWFANGDRGHYLRVEDGRFVLAEAEGAGAIVRIWSANPAGSLRIELDGVVVVEEDFLALLAGEVERFPPPFGATRARGGNLYFPFPYAERMKVTCSEGDQYYHVNVRTYEPGTAVTTYDPAQPLERPTFEPKPVGSPTTTRRLRGPGVVRRLEIDLPDDAARLRAATVRVRVDGRDTIWSPLGDLFGTSPGRTPFETYPIGIGEGGVGRIDFPMPFADTFEIDVEPDAGVRLWVTEDVRPLRFFAWWRGRADLATHPRSDWPVLHAMGAGRLVGCSLGVRNPIKAWWGEGDEKIFVDGESFPSTFGTGTEDYFGYAWCDTALFEAPYHAQTRCDGPINRGFCAVNRFHVIDDVPFQSSIRFDLEVWHWVPTTLAFGTVAYWYATPESLHDFRPAVDRDRVIVPLPEIPSVPGAIEGETFEVVEKTAGIAERQDLGFADGFSRESHLWWRDAKPGDVLTLRFHSPHGGRRSLVLALTRAIDYGIVEIAVNGHALGGSIDLFADHVGPDGERTFEDVPLVEGANEMAVKIVGTNENARPRNYMFGVDYVRVPD